MKKTVEQQIYAGSEQGELVEAAFIKYKETKNTAYLAIIMNFSLGLRVGELVALQRNDFIKRTVHIQRQEIKGYDQETLKRKGYQVVGYTKSLAGDRVIPVTEVAQKAFRMIVKSNMEQGFTSEYLLLDRNGERIHNDVINRLLRRLNKEAGLIQKSNHNIRKTCFSNLAQSKLLTDEEIRTFAGHEEISTTQKSYIFATESLNDRADVYETALDSKMRGVFKCVQNF